MQKLIINAKISTYISFGGGKTKLKLNFFDFFLTLIFG